MLTYSRREALSKLPAIPLLARLDADRERKAKRALQAQFAIDAITYIGIVLGLLLVLALIALAFAKAARADTLVIVHPTWTETVTGTINEHGLVVSADFGQIGVDATEVVCSPVDCLHIKRARASRIPASVPGAVPWQIFVTYAGLESRDDLSCASFLRYFEGYPNLTVTCDE